MKRIKIKGWTEYGFEFLSIFIAVIAAFALNNWNDNRKSQKAEEKILTEIFNGLAEDKQDLDLNEMGHELGRKATIYFRDLFSGRAVSKDSAKVYFLYLTRDYISIQNTSGYETLKSRGLELLENDSLRAKIISLYENDYNILRKLEEEYFEFQLQKNYYKDINRVLLPYFIFDENNTLVGIENPLKISEDNKRLMLSYLWRIEVNRSLVLNYYTEVKRKLEEVRKEIKNEIDA